MFHTFPENARHTFKYLGILLENSSNPYNTSNTYIMKSNNTLSVKNSYTPVDCVNN